MKHVKGNLVTMAYNGDFDMIVHGCNCFCTMGSGIAPQIADMFHGSIGPREIDNMTERGDRSKLGSVSVAAWAHPETYKSLIIFNAYTQYDFARSPNDTPVDYAAVRSCFKQIAYMVQKYDASHDRRSKIGYPAIGAGLAGGDWSIIAKIISEELNGLDHTYVEWDGTLD